MTLIYILLTIGFLAPVGWLAQMIRHEELAEMWPEESDPARLLAPLPEAREWLTPLPPVHQPPRVRPAWDTPTGEFWKIVDDNFDLEQPCAHCDAPEDGEPAHVGCPGCACPCRLPELVAA